jgi:hypothetical protein
MISFSLVAPLSRHHPRLPSLNPAVETCSPKNKERNTRFPSSTDSLHLERNRIFTTPKPRAKTSQNARPSTAFPSLGRKGNVDNNELIALREKALLRVINTKRKEKQQKEKEIMKEKMMEEKRRCALQLKHSQKERQRAEIYAINRILKQKFDEQYQKFLDCDGGNLTSFHTSA